MKTWKKGQKHPKKRNFMLGSAKKGLKTGKKSRHMRFWPKKHPKNTPKSAKNVKNDEKTAKNSEKTIKNAQKPSKTLKKGSKTLKKR